MSGMPHPQPPSPHDPYLAVIVVGGAPLPEGADAILATADLVVAADSGLDLLWLEGRQAHLIVGDLDSVSPEVLAKAEASGAQIERHPMDKDATDTELAVSAALHHGARRVTLLAGGGDRLDHLIGWLTSLAAPELAVLAGIDAWVGTTHVEILHGPRTSQWTHERPRGVFSLIPLAGMCSGVTTQGLRWALHGETLSPTSSRGISNEAVESTVTITLAQGVLAVMRPHRGAAHVMSGSVDDARSNP